MLDDRESGCVKRHMKGNFLFSFYINLKTTSPVNDLVFFIFYHLSVILCFSIEE